MASPQQIAANQANAQKSTGPRTLEGKRASRLNARKHGLCGQLIMLTDEEHAAYGQYMSRLLENLAPGNYVEQDFAERIVFNSWRLHKTGIISHHLLALGDALSGTDNEFEDDNFNDAIAYRASEQTLNSLSLYQQRLDRSIRTGYDLLRRMQKERRVAEAAQAAEAAKQAALGAAQVSKAAKTSKRPALQVIENPVPSPATGFVCATPPPHPPLPPVEPSELPENLAA